MVSAAEKGLTSSNILIYEQSDVLPGWGQRVEILAFSIDKVGSAMFYGQIRSNLKKESYN